MAKWRGTDPEAFRRIAGGVGQFLQDFPGKVGQVLHETPITVKSPKFGVTLPGTVGREKLRKEAEAEERARQAEIDAASLRKLQREKLEKEVAQIGQPTAAERERARKQQEKEFEKQVKETFATVQTNLKNDLSILTQTFETRENAINEINRNIQQIDAIAEQYNLSNEQKGKLMADVRKARKVMDEALTKADKPGLFGPAPTETKTAYPYKLPIPWTGREEITKLSTIEGFK